jgi:hypothetical protein
MFHVKHFGKLAQNGNRSTWNKPALDRIGRGPGLEQSLELPAF